MFAEQLQRAVEASPRVELAKVASLLWRAYAAGQVSEAEAQALSDLIEARRALPAPQKPPQRRSGSRPRTPASMERRRRWAASGALPPALAGVGRSTVKRALRAAQGLGFVRIEERRVSAWRNAPNVVTITSREWSAWLRMRGRGVGFNQEPPRLQENNKGTLVQRNRAWAAEGQGRVRTAQGLMRERFAAAWPASEP